ncbi:hypothetical protein GCM10009733_086500 [Nonomuraea maheshkhaliensis]|uniref:Secreted protein n=1 Tax=Nonomuraea maheshkhaliensis TaxID=419590 RepID=A0ABN2GSR8_9ACTN
MQVDALRLLLGHLLLTAALCRLARTPAVTPRSTERATAMTSLPVRWSCTTDSWAHVGDPRSACSIRRTFALAGGVALPAQRHATRWGVTPHPDDRSAAVREKGRPRRWRGALSSVRPDYGRWGEVSRWAS